MVAHCARVGTELGADVVKVPYTGDIESFARVTEACCIPVVIAGGPKVHNDRELIQMAHDAIQAGGSGLSIGRNVFQHARPSRMDGKQILADVGSVKTLPIAGMVARYPGPVVGTHPLFGPAPRPADALRVAVMNPARPTHQILGVPTAHHVPLMAEVLALTGLSCGAVVHGAGGFDEITPFGPADVCWLRDGWIKRDTIDPKDFGIPAHKPSDVVVSGRDEAVAVLRDILSGQGSPAMRDSLPAEVKDRLTVVRRIFKVPVALGFGIKSPEQLTAFGDLIDGVVFGSALIAHIEAGGTAAEFMRVGLTVFAVFSCLGVLLSFWRGKQAKDPTLPPPPGCTPPTTD